MAAPRTLVAERSTFDEQHFQQSQHASPANKLAVETPLEQPQTTANHHQIRALVHWNTLKFLYTPTTLPTKWEVYLSGRSLTCNLH